MTDGDLKAIKGLGDQRAKRRRSVPVGRPRLAELLAEVGAEAPPWLPMLLDDAAVSTVEVDAAWLSRTAERALRRREERKHEK